jgi:hypothetical protein
LPRAWSKVSFTNSPETFGVRLEFPEGTDPAFVDLPESFETEADAEAAIRDWKKAEMKDKVIKGGHRPPK